jgi:hypothetical protein
MSNWALVPQSGSKRYGFGQECGGGLSSLPVPPESATGSRKRGLSPHGPPGKVAIYLLRPRQRRGRSR